MSTSTRITVASLANEFRAFAQAQEAHNATVTAILANLTDSAPAVTAKPSPAKKATRKPAKKATTKAPTKGSQTRETLSRKDFNRTVTTKARLAGGATYKLVIANWDVVSEARDAGMTPDEVIAHFA